MNLSQHGNETACGQYDGQRTMDYAQSQKILAPYPSMSVKLNKVAELFESDVLSDEEALKACKVIIGQHAKVRGNTIEGEKIVKG